MKSIIIFKIIFALVLSAISFMLVGWKIFLAIFLMLWANNSSERQ